MKYINNLTDKELEVFFFNYFSRASLDKINAMRVVKTENSVDITLWQNKSGVEKYSFTDFSPIKKWVIFLYKKFGNSYLKDYNSFKKSYLKTVYKTEKREAIIKSKVDFLSYPEDERKDFLKKKLKEIKVLYIHRLDELEKFVNELCETEKE